MTTFIGAATSRIDGVAKVTGAAKYSAEYNVPGLAYGSIVTSTIAKGHVTRIDSSAARRVSGVYDVLTHDHRPSMASTDKAYKDEVAPTTGSPYRPLYDNEIKFSGQPIALVVAETSEIARYAASLVEVEYKPEPHVTDIHQERKSAIPVETPSSPFDAHFTPPKMRGNPDEALEQAQVLHVGEYFVPIEHHNPMELFAATVLYDQGGKLIVYDKTQGVQNVQRYVCSVLEMKPEDVRVISPFVGGAFGVGLRPQFEVVLASLAARALSRPVRVVLTRPQMYALGYRPAAIQKVSIGANRDGSLNAITHSAITATSQYEQYFRQETGWSGLLYKSANAGYEHRLAQLDLPTSCDMRSPSAPTAIFSLESAMDELAIELKMDPIALRLRCYSDRDQNNNLPFSSKALRECYQKGAEAFGWSKRNPQPRSMRDGGDLVGWGMATGIWEALQVPITVRIVLNANGTAEIACATSDIGTGTYTIIAQVGADTLGLPLENVKVRLGDSTLPQSPVEGGSWIATSVSNGVVTTSRAISDQLLLLAKTMPGSPLARLGPNDVVLANRRLQSKADATRSVSISDVMRSGGMNQIVQEKTTNPSEDTSRAHNTHSAVFAEVKVDEQLGVIRVTRVVSAVAVGRVLNKKTAHSQIMGSVVWGIGMALQEETVIDHKLGRIMNANIAEYHVPVNADIHDINVIFVDEVDNSNPLGVKGLGEIGIVGVAPAIANAVYHATGKRVRNLPITLDKVIA
ncbi:MAG: aldehyde oxidase [Hyphomicrobiales bacterium]|nr:aldehyde oxidase [Hyphomicrobiales bacterium]